MNLSSFKKISEVIRECLQFFKICAVFVRFFNLLLFNISIMGKQYHMKIYQDIIGEDLYKIEFNPVRRVMQMEKKLRGLEIILDSTSFGSSSSVNKECPPEISHWIDNAIYFPIKSGSLTLSELQSFSDLQTDLGAYSLKLYIREVIYKKGMRVDNYSQDHKIRNLFYSE